ncbi:hypothetical protein OF83DRAFT_1155122 [Amylostereum chailletii]|nr:hypothetical protein OF83DRAFT_1155122 [Amylostereum chailletii]
MSKRDKGKRTFAPKMAITDTDHKERGALLIVWPSIMLLLCKFPVRQCWRSKRQNLLGKIGDPTTKDEMRQRLYDPQSTPKHKLRRRVQMA